ncbi:MAG TPA: O-antigen ligase family protein [Ignavibacteria bacterium]|nr:O-antigen ligase family protein [Ignavibacteria bacterium]
MMNDFIINIENPLRDKSVFERSGFWIYQKIVQEKFYNWFGILVLLAITVCMSIVVSNFGLIGAIVALALVVGIPSAIASFFNLKFGVVFTIFVSFFILGIKRVSGDLQVGILMDLFIALLFFGMFVKQIETKSWKFANNPISKIILIWIVYNLLQSANPFAESRLAWVYTIRGAAGIMIFYFILLYTIESKKFITVLINLWIVLALIGALYGIFQEYVGFLPFETQWIMESPERYGLLFQAGKFRKFSFFSDPMIFGFLVAFTGILCFILATGPYKKILRLFYFSSGILMMMAMLFSSTRAAFVLPVAALAFISFITLNKKLMLFGVFAVFALGVILVIPSSNPEIVRLQSAFRPAQDPSYQTRIKNQAFIQPYIQSHPFGGGMGATGEWGKKFSPWSPLANFPPDSGYIRTAVEMGWVGLFLQLLMIFIVLYFGIKDYFRIKDKELKNYSLGMLTVLYCLAIANFPQEAIGQYPTNLLFFVAIAIINKCRQFDETSYNLISIEK